MLPAELLLSPSVVSLTASFGNSIGHYASALKTIYEFQL